MPELDPVEHPAGGVYLVPAFSGLLAPYWQDSARGTIIGLTGSTERGHIVRAMLEAIAFQVRAVLQAIAEDMGAPVAALRVDGGATSNDLLMQLQVRAPCDSMLLRTIPKSYYCNSHQNYGEYWWFGATTVCVACKTWESDRAAKPLAAQHDKKSGHNAPLTNIVIGHIAIGSPILSSPIYSHWPMTDTATAVSGDS